MTNTMPEWTATPLELARETARMLSCACGARPGRTCDGKGGMHLARFADARRFGLMSDDRMAAALEAAGDVFTPMTIVPGGAR
jgi:hypothetical protein